MFIQIIFVGVVILNYTSAQQGALNKEYKLERYFKANWFDSYLFCRDHGMRLATVTTDYEQEAITNLITGNGQGNGFGNGMEPLFENIWISGTDLAEDGQYMWFSTGQPITFSYWDMGQPVEHYVYDPTIIVAADNVEDCVQIRSDVYRWSAANCSSLNYFICERV